MKNSVEDGVEPSYNRASAQELFEKVLGMFDGMPGDLVMDVLINSMVTAAMDFGVDETKLIDAVSTTYRVYNRSKN